MNKLYSASKFRIFAIISCAIIVIGMALGTVFHFVSNGFFNYGGEYSSYKTITVSYSIVELNGEDIDIEEICDTAIAESGANYYSKTNGSSFSDERQIEYRFAVSEDSAALDGAVTAINNKIAEALSQYIGGEIIKTHAQMSVQTGLLGGGFTLWRAAVALAVIVAVQLIYTAIRYKLSAAIVAAVMDLHNLALYAALLAICRIPVSSSALVYGIILTLVTVVCVTLLLERIKRNAKDNAGSIQDAVVASAGQTLKTNVALPVFLAVVSVLFFVAVSIESLSVIAALIPMAMALASFAVTVYGNVFLAPNVYIFIKNIGTTISKPSSKKGN